MSIREQPHYRLQARLLADWLSRDSSWWSVDGDPFLTGELSFPCPSDELAAELRKINKPLLLLAPEENPHRQILREVSLSDLDRIGRVDGYRDRAFQLCWENDTPEIDWILAENIEIAQMMAKSA